jgi:hypothetical protein
MRFLWLKRCASCHQHPVMYWLGPRPKWCDEEQPRIEEVTRGRSARLIKVVGSAALKELQGDARRAIGGVSAAEKKAAVESEKLAKKTADTKAKEATRAAQAATKAAAKANADAEKLAKKTSAAESKAAQDAAKDRAKAADEAAKAAKKTADAQIKEAERATERWRKLELDSLLARTRAAEREAAKQSRISEQTAAKRQKDAISTLRKAGGFVGGATAGVLAGAVAAGGVARSVAGVDDVQTRVQKAGSFRERLIVTAGQAGLDDAGTAAAQAGVQRASIASGKDSNELVGVLEAGQAKFNDLKFFSDNLEGLAVRAKATGSDTVALAEAVGYLKQAFGLSGKEAMESADLMIAAASKGSIEAKDFATDFASVAGIFAEGTGMKGIGGVREFLGVAQAGGTLGKGSAETATMMERFIALLQDTDKMKDLRERDRHQRQGQDAHAGHRRDGHQQEVQRARHAAGAVRRRHPRKPDDHRAHVGARPHCGWAGWRHRHQEHRGREGVRGGRSGRRHHAPHGETRACSTFSARRSRCRTTRSRTSRNTTTRSWPSPRSRTASRRASARSGCGRAPSALAGQ